MANLYWPESYEMLDLYAVYRNHGWLTVVVLGVMVFLLLAFLLIYARKVLEASKAMAILYIVVLGALIASLTSNWIVQNRVGYTQIKIKVTEDVNIYEFMNEFHLIKREGAILTVEPVDQDAWGEWM